jgi:hypothetical protein
VRGKDGRASAQPVACGERTASGSESGLLGK